MNKATGPVLELLAEDFVANCRAIWYTLESCANSPEDAPGKSTIYRTLDKLAENGYIRTWHKNDSYYVITERGRRYLAGDLEDDET